MKVHGYLYSRLIFLKVRWKVFHCTSKPSLPIDLCKLQVYSQETKPFSQCKSKLGSMNWLQPSQTGERAVNRSRDILLCKPLPIELFVYLLIACLFSPSFRLLGVFRLEICWEKHGGLLLPLLLMLQGGRAMQIILEEEMWHGGRGKSQEIVIAWKHFNNFCFSLCLKKFKGNKTQWLGLQNRVTPAKHNHKQLWY